VAIKCVRDLEDHLHRAVALELSTVPLYLYAYYSIEDPLSRAAQTLRSVVMQEMAHTCLATNLLVAIGGTPRFDASMGVPNDVPTYPSEMPFHVPSLTLRLQAASVPLVRDVFCAVERPMTVRDVPESGQFTTIGQFYAAIMAAFHHLLEKDGAPGVFVGERWRQLTTGYHGGYAGATGHLVDVHDLASARAAIHEIVRQGEGSARGEGDGEDGDELAHYWRFNQIADRTVPLRRVLPVVTDPSTAALPPGPLRDLSQLFDDAYGLLLRLMQRTWTEPDGATRARLVAALVPVMVRVLKPIARILVTLPIPGQEFNAGPSFTYSATPQAAITDACARLIGTFQALAPVAQALELMPPIDVAVPA
jgi:hypothetical protein